MKSDGQARMAEAFKARCASVLTAISVEMQTSRKPVFTYR